MKCGRFCFAKYIFLSILILHPQSASSSPAGSALGLEAHTLDADQIKKVMELGQKTLSEQVSFIKEKFDLELIASHRKAPQKFFEMLGPAKRSLDQITDVEGLYGKAVCPKKSERPKILIADDAPPSTLLHEYLHGLQIQARSRWCELDSRVLDSDEKRDRAILYHSFEFEVLKTLWDLRGQLPLTIEDRLILVEGLTRENKLFMSMGIKALDDETSQAIENEFEDAKVRLDFFTWLTKTPAEASSVLQKLEVISLKSCIEKTEGKNDTEKINRCIKKRCEYSKMSCHEIEDDELKPFKDDLISKVIFSWVKPNSVKECGISKLKDEFINGLEQSTTCWRKWYESRGQNHEKNLSLRLVNEKEVLKRFDVPALSVDKKTIFYEAQNPEALINKTYCYFVFQKVIRFESLPVDQFPYSMMGASLSTLKFSDYKTWLKKDDKGKLCTRIVKLFSGEEPQLPPVTKKAKYLLVFNPIAALTGGIEQLKDNLAIDINHERLHSVFADSAIVRTKVKNEWLALSTEEQQSFKKRHSSYDFKNEEVLLREYFSYSRQHNPRQLF
jgi:hypothetical protein